MRQRLGPKHCCDVAHLGGIMGPQTTLGVLVELMYGVRRFCCCQENVYKFV